MRDIPYFLCCCIGGVATTIIVVVILPVGFTGAAVGVCSGWAAAGLIAFLGRRWL